MEAPCEGACALAGRVRVDGGMEAGGRGPRAGLRDQRREHHPPGQAAGGAGALPPGPGGMGSGLGGLAAGLL
eukprot:13995216-Alexandrium_andersonii.AAC.1